MNEKQKRAADVIAAGGTRSEAARQAEVDRSTVTRWVRDDDFQRLILEAQDDASPGGVAEQATLALSDLVTKAVGVIDKTLEGDKSMVASARVALDVIKTAAQLAPKGASGTDTPPLADLIDELDKRDKAKPPTPRK